GVGTNGSADGDALSAAQFNFPTKLSIAAHHLFVGDMDNCAVREVDLVASEVSTVAGSPATCTANDGPLETASFASVVAVFYAPAYGIVVGSGNWGWRNVPVSAALRLVH